MKRWCEKLGVEVRDTKKKNQRYVEPKIKWYTSLYKKKIGIEKNCIEVDRFGSRLRTAPSNS